MKTYRYDGPVLVFDRIFSNHWVCATEAVSEEKAKANLSYKFKKQHNMMPNCKITLPGKMVVS
jgi:hypothetical protein